MSHEHDWQPDGDSFTEKIHRENCDWDNENYRIGNASKKRMNCVRNCDSKRMRRYTCHCGASKTVDLKESGDKQ